MTFEEEERMLKGWRGRRLLACRAADLLAAIVNELGNDNGVDPFPGDGSKPNGNVPQVSNATKQELENMVSLLLRMILLNNDGHVSHQRLPRY